MADALPQRIHFVGIGGIGMSGLARLLLEEGHQVSGSDLQSNNLTTELAALGATVYQGHDPSNVGEAELVVATPAAHSSNPELQEATQRAIPILKRGELLGKLMEGKRGIAIAGSHGKTTTTALIGWILTQAGLDPTVVVGGEVPELGGNVRRGAGDFFVAEADEYDAAFLSLHPEVAVVTNIEAEHLDFYKDFASVVEAFRSFLKGVIPSGHVVFCLDDPAAAGLQSSQAGEAGAKLNTKHQQEGGARLTRQVPAQSFLSYGLHPQAHWRAVDLKPNSAGGHDFTVRVGNRSRGRFSLQIPGQHNVSNALAALAATSTSGVDPSRARDALATFTGVKRRFQVLGTIRGITIIDDYAHHPSEVRATLAAARTRYPDRRILTVFQPHTYSRIKLLQPLYTDAFQDASVLWVTDIYAAREDNSWEISGQDLVNSIDHCDKYYVKELADATDAVQAAAQPGDVVLVMGAGDSYKVAQALVDRLEKANDLA